MKRLTHKEAVDTLHSWGQEAMPALKARTPAWMIPYLEFDIMTAGLDSDEEEPEDTLPPLATEKRAEVRQYSDKWVTTVQCSQMGYMDDFTTPQEKQLGRIMHEKGSDFYIVDKFPLEVCTSRCFGTASNFVPTIVFVLLLPRILAHLHWLQRRRVVYPLPPLLYPAHTGACGYNRPCAYM